MKLLLKSILLFSVVFIQCDTFGELNTIGIANNLNDFFVQNLKKSHIVNSWQLKVRILELELSDDTYEALLNAFSANDAFSDLIDEKKILELTNKAVVKNKFSYELNFSKTEFRLKKTIPPEYIVSTENTGRSFLENGNYIYYENCINGLSSTYNSSENILRFFKSNINPFVQVIADYGIDICLLPLDGLLRNIQNRKIDLKVNQNVLEIKTSVNEGYYEKIRFTLKNGFIYCLSNYAKMISADIYAFYAGYKEEGSMSEICFPKLKILLIKSRKDKSIKGTFYFIDSWELKKFNEHDFEIPINKNAKIENIE